MGTRVKEENETNKEDKGKRKRMKGRKEAPELSVVAQD